MSYSIAVVTRDGVTTVETTGDVPDGRHDISGHDYDHGSSLSLTRRDLEGRYVTHAEHHAQA